MSSHTPLPSPQQQAARLSCSHKTRCARNSGRSRPSVSAGLGHGEIFLALAVFAVLCVAVLRYAPALVEPDDFAYRGSIVAMTQGHTF
jgi:hypothetical protein